MTKLFSKMWAAAAVGLVVVGALAGCKPKADAGAGAFAMPPGGLPVQAEVVSASTVPVSDTYVSTIKSRRSATMNPQVDGNLTAIAVHSGEHVAAGQLLMEIDPVKQRSTLESAAATEQQKLAVYQYNQDRGGAAEKAVRGGDYEPGFV